MKPNEETLVLELGLGVVSLNTFTSKDSAAVGIAKIKGSPFALGAPVPEDAESGVAVLISFRTIEDINRFRKMLDRCEEWLRMIGDNYEGDKDA